MSALAEAEAEDGDDVAEARDVLREAVKARAKAVKNLEVARAGSARGRALVAALAGEVETHERASKRVTARRTEHLKAALKTGKAPSFEQVAEVPAIEAKRLEASSRLEAAKAALTELERDEAEATSALAAAEGEIKQAVKGVVLAEAEAIALELIELDAEAAQLHEKLGVRTFFLGQFLAPFGTELSRTSPLVARGMSGVVWGTNDKPMRRSLAHMETWKTWVAALAKDPNSVLRFDEREDAEAAGLELLAENARAGGYR